MKTLSARSNIPYSMDVRIGCGGWSHDEWVGPFYPVGLTKRKPDWLSYYAGFFKTVEIMSTLHSKPDPNMVDAWIDKAKHIRKFEYSPCLPRKIGDSELNEGKGDGAFKLAIEFYEDVVTRLAGANMLGCVILQLGPAVGRVGKFGRDNLPKLQDIFDGLDTKKFPLAVEFNNKEWFNRRKSNLAQDVRDLLGDYDVTYCMVDRVGIQHIQPVTASHAVLRLYGTEDGLYPPQDMELWADNITQLSRRVKTLRVYLHNFHSGGATKNAMDLMDLLNIPHPEKNIHVQSQQTLLSFV